MTATELAIEPQPHAASSIYYAINSAPEHARERLLGLYALHRKWREAANYTDNHQAVTTLNWWHHELERSQNQSSEHPALRAQQSASSTLPHTTADALQTLLHGHMHWHHLNRVDTEAQLQATIDAIGGSFAQLWMDACAVSATNELTTAAGRALIWTDLLRHIGHNLSHQRIWIPMQWLKETQTPAHLLLKTDQPSSERAQQLQALIQRIASHAQTELNHYQQQFKQLPQAQRKALRSWHILMQLRADLLPTIAQDPAELFEGLVSIAPLRKWWRVVRT